MDAGVLGAKISSLRPHLAAGGKAPKTVKLIVVGDRDPVQGDAEIAAVSGQDLGVAGQRVLLALAVLGHDEPVAAQRDAAGTGGNRAGQGFPERSRSAWRSAETGRVTPIRARYSSTQPAVGATEVMS